MSFDDRYAIERVKDRLWVVIDRVRQGRPVGRAADEAGAVRIASLLIRIRRLPGQGRAERTPTPRAA